MSDPNDLKVEISTGDSLGELHALTSAVTGLTSAFKSLDALGLAGLRSDFGSMKTSMSELVKSLDGLSGQMAPKVRKAMTEATQDAAVGGKKLGKAMGDGVTAGLKEAGDTAILTVRAERARLQAEYEKFAGMQGAKIKLGALASLKSSGVALYDDDKARLQKHLADLLTVNNIELADYRATVKSKGELESSRIASTALEQLAADKMELQAFRATEKSKGELESSRIASTALEQLAADKMELQAFRATEKSKEASEKARIASTSADQLAADAMELQAFRRNEAVKRQLIKDRDLNATFSAMSPAAQLTRSARVSAIAVDGPGTDYATKKYGSAAVDLSKDTAAQALLTAEILRTADATSALSTGKVGLKKSTAEATAEAHRLRASQKELRGEMNELHSAARGLASGFGAMWLTWGSIVPLMAGAAISTSLVQAVKSGSEFENTLRTLGELSGASAEDLKMLSAEALRMGSTSKYGPLEVAEALKTLALAGLDATEQMTALKPTLNFATVGEMDIGKAAESLTAISTAFGYSATGFSAVGDVVAKAAAISMSSVSDMTEAFRQASTIAQQFGVSITDASLTLALLAQVGIRGSAAGTAMRNMYNELIGSSKQARDILQNTLGVDIIDKQTKKVKDLSVVIGDLAGALGKFEFKDQLDLLGRLGNERGTKAISAVMTSMVTEIQKAGGEVTTLFKDMQQQMADAPGFVAMASIGMALTAKNQIATVGNAMQSALIEAFQAAQPAVLIVASELRSAINSEEFKAGLKSLVDSLAEFVGFVVRNIDVFASIAAGFALGAAALVTFKLAAVAAAVVLPPLGLAIGALAAGSTVSLAALAAAFWPVTAAIAVVGAAWWLLSDDTKKSTEKAQQASQASFKATMEGLDAEAKRLEEQMLQRAEGGAQETIAASTRMALARQDLMTMHQQERATLQLGKARIISALAGLDDSGADAYRKRLLTAELEALRNNVADAVVNQVKVEAAFDDNVRRVKNLATKDAKEAKERAEADRKVQEGARKLAAEEAAAEAAKARAKSPVALVFDKDKELEQIKTRYSSQLSVIKDAESAQKSLLNSQRSNNLISQSEFHFRELALTVKAEKDQLDLLDSTNKKYQETYGERTQGALDALRAWDKDPRNAGATEAQRAEKTAQFTQEVEKLSGAYETFMKGQEDAKSKVENGTMTRLQMQGISMAGALKKAQDASDDFWKAEEANQAKAIRQENLDDLLRYASPEARAYLTATAAEQERLTAEVNKHDVALKAAEDALFDYVNRMQTAQVVTAAMNQGEAAAVALLEQQVALRKKITDALPGKVEDAGQRAMAKVAKESEAELVKSLAGAVETGLFEGSKAGSKKLRDIIVAELRKPITVYITAAVQAIMQGGMNAFGLGGAGGALGAGGSGGMMQLASGAKSIYDLANGNLGTIGSSVYNGISNFGTSSLGQSLGMSQMTSGVNYSLTGSSAFAAPTAQLTEGMQSFATSAGQIANIAGTALAALQGLKSLKDGNYAAAIGSGIGYYLGGPIGSAIGNTIGGFVDDLFAGDSGTYHSGGTGSYSAEKGVGYGGGAYSFGMGGSEYTQSANVAAGQLATAVGGILDTAAAIAGSQSKAWVGTGFADDSSSDGAWGGLMIKLGDKLVTDWGRGGDKWPGREFADGEAGQQQYLNAIATDVRKALDTVGLPSWAKAMLDSLGTAPTLDNLAKTVQEIQDVKGALAALGNVFPQLTSLSADAAGMMMRMYGGAQNMFASLGTFYENFYTPEQKSADLAAQTSKAFKALGVAMPAASAGMRDWYRELGKSMLALDQSVPANATATAAVLSLQGAVNTLAPDFGTAAESVAASAESLVKSFTGTARLSPALRFATLAVGDFTGGTTAMSGELRFINSIMGDSTSAVIGFRDGAYVLGTELSASQQSAMLLQSQMDTLGRSADRTRIDFVGLGEALSSASTETFVATVAEVFENLASRISSVLGDINTERVAVREAALSIIDPTALSKIQIKRGIDAVSGSGPSDAGLLSARASLTSADANVLAAQAASTLANSRASSAGAAVSAQQNSLAAIDKAFAPVAAAFKSFTDYRDWAWSGAGTYSESMGLIAPNNQKTAQFNADSAAYAAQRAVAVAQLTAANAAYSSSTASAGAYAQALSAATAVQAAAATAAKSAALAYSSALQDFVIDAGTSVNKLTRLREETVKYYESQKALADLMSTSAAGLRATVADFRFGQMSDEGKFETLAAQFSLAYSSAAGSTGEDLAAYGDKLNSLISPLIASLQATGRDAQVENYLAQAESVAALIEAATPVNYQADSLALLDSIDIKLLALGNATLSAEVIIADAVKAGSDRTAEGLRAVIAALTGQAVPAFAAGGFHSGGIRLVGENGPELEVTGPSRIYNANDTSAMFGGDTARLEALVERQARQLEAMSFELRAIAVSTAKMTKQGERVEQEGILIRAE